MIESNIKIEKKNQLKMKNKSLVSKMKNKVKKNLKENKDIKK
jgi:hypothetical protein